MKSFEFRKLDAFATATSSGNPAGAVYVPSFDDITEADMQRIARELKGFVSEVGFIGRIAPDAFRLRYFSSEKEVQFCGHATIAIAHDLVSRDRHLAELPSLFFHTNKGTLAVENREGAVFIHAPVPTFTECAMPLQEIAGALDIAEGSIGMNIGIVNAGNQTLCVPLKGIGDVVSAAPDFTTLQAFCLRHGLDVITIFSDETADSRNQWRTRVFAAPFGYLEDPATGSGNAALAYHLHRLGQWDGSPARIEQNADLDHPNIVRIASVPDAECGLKVLFGGSAILRIEGRYFL